MICKPTQAERQEKYQNNSYWVDYNVTISLSFPDIYFVGLIEINHTLKSAQIP